MKKIKNGNFELLLFMNTEGKRSAEQPAQGSPE